MRTTRLRELDVAAGGGGMAPIAAASGAVRIGDRLFVVADRLVLLQRGSGGAGAVNVAEGGGSTYELLLVADADDPGTPSPLLRAVL